MLGKIKKTAVFVMGLQTLLLLTYFTSLLAWIDPPDYILFPVWFAIGIAGIVKAAILIAKKVFLPLAMPMVFLSLIILAIGGLMRLFVTM